MSRTLNERTSLRIISVVVLLFGAWHVYLAAAQGKRDELVASLVLVAIAVLGFIASSLRMRRR